MILSTTAYMICNLFPGGGYAFLLCATPVVGFHIELQ
jgi:hypothetical protein